ncbi:MAG: glycosyltransferase [Methanomicrobiales archaeon]|nr:glycosyltransferase [Methanomicrobiales archaeon]
MINDALIVFWARFFMRRFHLSNPVIMFYEPRFSCVVGKLGEVLSCYEVVDDRLEFSEVPRWIKDNVDFLTENVDLITVSANILYNKILKKREKDLYIIGNGVDIDRFMKAREDIPLPPDIQNIARPIAGYVGAIGEWFDFQLIEIVLHQCPDISVVLIGPVFPEQTGLIKKLESTYPNIHVLGKKPYSLLPHYIKAFDVCLIPFQVNELTNGVNPNKAYEYAAAGKPIVSTYLPELDRYKHIIRVAKDHVEFVDSIRSSINSKPDVDGLLRIAEENTWDNRSEDYIRLLIRYVSNKAVCSGLEV